MADRSNARHVTERWRVSVTHYVQNILVFEGFMKRRSAREMKYNYIDIITKCVYSLKNCSK
jgi:hypothetical protein